MFTVKTAGHAWGKHRRFVCDEHNNVVAEAYGDTRLEARQRAELLADAMNNDAGEEN